MDGTRRTSSRRDFLKLAGASSMAALLAACGGAPAAAPATGGASGAPAGDTTATLTIFDFGGDADKKIYADAHARFKQKYSKVTIADNFTPVTTWSEYEEQDHYPGGGGCRPTSSTSRSKARGCWSRGCCSRSTSSRPI
jgi:hypothetical protein